jgi:hypothetical protein
MTKSKANLKLVEDKANGPAVIQALRHEIRPGGSGPGWRQSGEAQAVSAGER